MKIALIYFIPDKDLSIFLLHCKPLIVDELELLPCLKIPNNNHPQEPGSIITNTSIVMPDSQVVQLSQGPKIIN